MQKSDSYRRVFLCLYSISDQSSTFELDAAKLAQATGLSRKTVYKVVAFLQRVNLVKPITLKTGRGQHSVYRLNWRKPAKTHESAKQKKCHPLLRYSMKLNNIHPSGDGPAAISGDIISPANRQQWNRCLKSFREILGNSALPGGYLRVCTGVLGRHLKGKKRGYALKLFEKLREVGHKLRVPGWVRSIGDLCRWFMGVLKNLFKPKPKRRRFTDYNEYVQYLHYQEVERVRLKRMEYEERSVSELWRDWAAMQRMELAWKRRQLELARERLAASSVSQARDWSIRGGARLLNTRHD